MLVGARQLYGEILEQHIERSLGRAVTVPSAKPVVANRPDTRRQCGKDPASVAWQQGQHVFRNQRRANRIERENLRHYLRIKLAITAFRPCAIRQRQHSGGDNDAIRRVNAHHRSRIRKSAFLRKIKGKIPHIAEPAIT